MSRPHYYWYGIVKKMVSMYPALGRYSTPQAGLYKSAVEAELENVDSEHEYAIREILIRKRTLYAVSCEVGYSESTVKKWISTFITKVGKRVGF